MRRVMALAVVVLAGGAAVAAIAVASPGGERRGHGDHRGRHLSAVLVDATGQRVGRVTMSQRRNGPVLVTVRANGLAPGFHGFHVHAVGQCTAPDFTSAGGHHAKAGQTHGQHAGDLPVLRVGADGKAFAASLTDGFTLADLRDQDGSAIVVHGGPDNYANIPARYGTPDATTLATGDSGARVACGVLR